MKQRLYAAAGVAMAAPLFQPLQGVWLDSRRTSGPVLYIIRIILVLRTRTNDRGSVKKMSGIKAIIIATVFVTKINSETSLNSFSEKV